MSVSYYMLDMGTMKTWLMMAALVAITALEIQGQSLPTTYEYYTEGGITAGVDEFPDVFQLNKKNITILSGGLHYFRVHPAYWRDRLQKLRAMGANTVETYVPWNLHEPSPGKFDFGNGTDDMSPFLDVVKFIKMAQEEDLLAIVRPGPYICAEFEFGGMPSWILRDREVQIRSSDPKFEALVEKYFTALFSLLVDLQFTNGGPIIAWQVENEYGNTKGSLQPVDQQYLINLHEMMQRLGLKEMFFTSDTPANPGGGEGNVPGVLRTANFKRNPEFELNVLKLQQPDKPLMVMEYWTGWFDHWMNPIHATVTADVYSDILERILQYPSSVNLYMFHGGTNWGFLNGANVYPYFPFYSADVTSYDYDAPLSEAGDYTAKYTATQQLFDQYNPVKTKLPKMPSVAPKVAYPAVAITSQIAYEDIIGQIPASDRFALNDVTSMEMLDMNDGAGQQYGYIVYRKKGVKLGQRSVLKVTGKVHGIATVIVDGVTKTKALTDEQEIREFGYWIKKDAELELDAASSGTRTVDIMVENFGRNNFGRITDFDQRKGLYDGPVLVDNTEMHGYEVLALQFKGQWVRSLKGWESTVSNMTAPSLYRGELTVSEPRDTFLDMTAWGKGVVFVNGFNLGRYFNIGPQRSLYLPAPLLRTGRNEIVVFEQIAPAAAIVFTKLPILGDVEQKN